MLPFFLQWRHLDVTSKLVYTKKVLKCKKTEDMVGCEGYSQWTLQTEGKEGHICGMYLKKFSKCDSLSCNWSSNAAFKVCNPWIGSQHWRILSHSEPIYKGRSRSSVFMHVAIVIRYWLCSWKKCLKSYSHANLDELFLKTFNLVVLLYPWHKYFINN